ncbi:MAG: hypothetical protein IKN78_11905 [Bacteroidales bacterium]|nr:hypothetical protein [Bacteroidales bacterium]
MNLFFVPPGCGGKKNGVDGVNGVNGLIGVMGLMGRMRGEKHYESDCFSGAMPLQGDLFSFFITPPARWATSLGRSSNGTRGALLYHCHDFEGILMGFLGREGELYWDFAFIYVDFSYLCKRFESKIRIDYEIENCSSGR